MLQFRIMAGDTLMFSVRVAATRYFLEKLPRECKNWRDTNLQASKMERMVEKFHKRFWPVQAAKILGGGDVSRARKKEMGDELAKMGEQHKRLKASLAKTVEEGFYIRNPKTEITPRQFRRLLAENNRDFEKVIIEATKRRRNRLFYGEDGEPGKLPG